MVRVNKIFGVATILIVIVIVGLVYFISSKVYVSFPVTLLNEKPLLSGQFIKNPDMIHSSSGWLSPIPENIILEPNVVNNSDWEGTGYAAFNSEPLAGRIGIVVIHPISRDVGRYVEQSVNLPTGEYVLYVGLADTAGLDGHGIYKGDCADVGIKVTINDINTNKSYTVFDKIIRNGRWYDYSIDLGSTFGGHNIRIRVESYNADGGCGSWNGEWATVDYIDIVKKR
jgi:hypothetical protein